MSRAEIVPVAPGDANAITDPNTTISNLSTATGSIDGVNVRLEAVDRRILKAPTNGFVNYYQDDSGDHDISTTGDRSMTRRLEQTTYTDVPTYDNNTGPAVLTVNGTDLDFVIIRCSFAVEIEGRALGAASTARQPILYTRLTRNGFDVSGTERAWQCNNLSTSGNSTKHNVRQATHVHWIDPQPELPSTSNEYRVQYKLDFDGNTDGAAAGDDYRIRDMNFSAVGYRKS